MDHENEPHGPGDDREEEGPGTPWLPPDDRLWRHPSEVRGNPAPLVAPAGTMARWTRRAPLWAGLVGALSGIVAALASVGVLLATGVIGTPTAVITPIHHSSGPATDPPGKAEPNWIGVLGMTSPSVVGITVTGPNGVVPGSGVLVATVPSGDQSYIVTDSALFAEAGSPGQVQVQVVTDWGQTQTGYLVTTDPFSGIALVKAVLQPVTEAAADGANVGSVANVQTGEQIMVVGSSPMAAADNEPDFAPGFLSDTLSYLPPVNGGANGLFSLLVADVPVVSPDYGGAVVDVGGNVLGITEDVPDTPPGLTYVVPIDTVMAEVDSMIKDGQAGPSPWLGVLEATDASGASGVQVEYVASGSPVAKIGVVDHDVITALDGRGISSVGSLVSWLSDEKPGEVMTVSWLHDGRPHRAVITLGTQPASANQS